LAFCTELEHFLLIGKVMISTWFDFFREIHQVFPARSRRACCWRM
jgi:hypothetical protein